MKHYLMIGAAALVLVGAGCAPEAVPTETEENDVQAAASKETELTNGTYAVNTEEGEVRWYAEKITGYGHLGRVDVKEGSAVVENGSLTSGSIIMDMSTISVMDDMAENMKTQLINHLNSDDFFSTEEYPEASFALTSYEDGVMSGVMTIKGIDQDVSFDADLTETENGFNVSGMLYVDRSLFDVRFGSASFFADLGDAAIRDEIEYMIDLNFDLVESEAEEEIEEEDEEEGSESETTLEIE